MKRQEFIREFNLHQMIPGMNILILGSYGKGKTFIIGKILDFFTDVYDIERKLLFLSYKNHDSDAYVRYRVENDDDNKINPVSISVTEEEDFFTSTLYTTGFLGMHQNLLINNEQLDISIRTKARNKDSYDNAILKSFLREKCERICVIDELYENTSTVFNDQCMKKILLSGSKFTSIVSTRNTRLLSGDRINEFDYIFIFEMDLTSKNDFYPKCNLLQDKMTKETYSRLHFGYLGIPPNEYKCLVIDNIREELFLYDANYDDGLPHITKDRKDFLDEIINEGYMPEGLGIIKREGPLCKDMMEEIVQLNEEASLI